MAESKRTFQSAKMDKDIDDRILPAGTYRDALNVSVDFSEDANVGALENLKGNELLANQDILGLSAATNPNAKVIGSITHPEEQRIYYFVTGDKTDGIFEYDAAAGAVSTVIVDSSEESVTAQTVFNFENAGVSASISQSGLISVFSQLGTATSVSADKSPNTTGSPITQNVQVKVKTPIGFANYNDFVVGSVSAVQPTVSAPAPTTSNAINITSTTATLVGKLNRNTSGVTAVGFLWGYNTGGTALTLTELQAGTAGNNTVNTETVTSVASTFTKDITGLPSNKIISFVAQATNAVGTAQGEVKTFTSSAAAPAPSYNRLPENKLFIFPTIDDETIQSSAYYPGYGDFEKPDNNFYFSVMASKQSGLYADYDDLRNETGLLSNTGPATLTFNNAPPLYPNNFAKTRSEYITPSTTGIYTITASKTGLTSNSIQIRKGTPSNAVFTSNFTLNFAKTGTGAVPAVAVYDPTEPTSLHYNASPVPLASFKIGPFEQSHGNGAIIIPIANVTNATIAPGTTSSFTGFDPTKLDVSITGKTEGTDYNYYIAKEAMSIWGSSALGYAIPAVVIEADPYVLNGATNTATHTLNITYNY